MQVQIHFSPRHLFSSHALFTHTRIVLWIWLYLYIHRWTKSSELVPINSTRRWRKHMLKSRVYRSRIKSRCRKYVKYSMISYHIISYHIISYHIVSYRILRSYRCIRERRPMNNSLVVLAEYTEGMKSRIPAASAFFMHKRKSKKTFLMDLCSRRATSSTNNGCIRGLRLKIWYGSKSDMAVRI